MMDTKPNLDDLKHEEIRAWLEGALHGRVWLPRGTPDEALHLGILRLERTLAPPTRRSLSDGIRFLVRKFCADGRGDSGYVEELLLLAAATKDSEAASMLADLANRFHKLPSISREIRQSVLAALVDMTPPQPAEFWNRILNQAPEEYAPLSLSGLLAVDPFQAIQMLPSLPNEAAVGEAAALKLELAWNDLPSGKRSKFVQAVEDIAAPRCASEVAGHIKDWISSKSGEPSVAALTLLRRALRSELNGDFTAAVLFAKLRSPEPTLYP